MRRGIVLGALVAIVALSLAGVGAQGQSSDVKETHLVDCCAGHGNLFVINGGGGNTLALLTDNGVVLVDTKLAGWRKATLESLEGVSDAPVSTIINTHAHLEHTGSNYEFPGLEIIAHENTRTNMAKMDAFKGANAKFLPTKTFKDKLTLGSGGNTKWDSDKIELYYFGAGHTDGDIVVVFPTFKAAYLGDLYTGKSAPIIDAANGGSGVAFPDTLAKVLETIKGVNWVVQGHDLPPVDPKKAARSGHTGGIDMDWDTWADLQEYAAFNRDFLVAVREAKAAGKSAAQAAADLKTKLAEKYKDYNLDRVPANVEAIYNELK